MLVLTNIIKFLIIFVYGSVLGYFANMLIDSFVRRVEEEEKELAREQEALKKSNKKDNKKEETIVNTSPQKKKQTFLNFKRFTYSCGCERKGKTLVPLVGYFLVKGKCPSCEKKINKRYLIVELVTGVLFVINVLVNGFNFISFCNCLVIAALVTLSAVDFKVYEIPVEINYFILFIGIIVSIYDYRNIVEHIIGFLAVSVFTWVLMYLSGGAAIGGGDVKLMATCGLLLGWKVILLSFVVGCILGSIIHSIRMVIEKQKSMLAFGPYLSMGVFVGMLYGPAIIQWYLGLIR